jgi:hypothetical protein
MRVRLLVDLEVHDERLLREQARNSYRKLYGDSDWEADDVGEAAVEALILSADTPAPNEIGIEIIETRAELVDR